MNTTYPRDGFTFNGIPLTASDADIAHIRHTEVKYPSFLRHPSTHDDIQVDWDAYLREGYAQQKEFHRLLIACGVLTPEELGNYRICDEKDVARFLGPSLEGRQLFFRERHLRLAAEFKDKVLPNTLTRTGMVLPQAQIAQMVTPPQYVTRDLAWPE